MLTLIFGDTEFTQDIREAGIKMDFPGEEWFLADKKENNGVVVYMFKRTPIPDNEQRQIIPNIAVIIEDIDEDIDPVQYSALKRMKMPVEIDEVFIHDTGRIRFKNAVGYKGHYEERGLAHTVYIVHAVHEAKGLQIIFDVTTNILDKVDPEFLVTLKSIRGN